MEHKEDEYAEVVEASATADVMDSDGVIEDHTLNELKASLLLDANNLRESTLKAKLIHMWTAYLSNASSTSVTDFLSVRHLGCILEHLAQTG